MVDVIGTPEEMLSELRGLGLSISETYPYAWLLGRALRQRRPEWWRSYEEAAAPLPALAQAAEYGFVRWLEARGEDIDADAAAYLSQAPGSLRIELDNTLRWYRERASAQRP